MPDPSGGVLSLAYGAATGKLPFEELKTENKSENKPTDKPGMDDKEMKAVAERNKEAIRQAGGRI